MEKASQRSPSIIEHCKGQNTSKCWTFKMFKSFMQTLGKPINVKTELFVGSFTTIKAILNSFK